VYSVPTLAFGSGEGMTNWNPCASGATVVVGDVTIVAAARPMRCPRCSRSARPSHRGAPRSSPDDTGASNGPTEGLNLCVKKVKRCGHGFR